MIKVASLQYQFDFPKNFDVYREKISRLVDEHAEQGVQILLFPECAGLEMLSFTSIEKLQDYLPAYLDLFQELSRRHCMLICCGSQIVEGFNRSYLFSPSKKMAYQDKCVRTPFETGEGMVAEGTTVQLFDTELGKMGICICYDSEFPPLAKKLVDAGAQVILVPSYTISVHGFNRVFLSCRARALENQCYVIQSVVVGQTDAEMTYGAAAICGPVDEGFPEDGLIALGTRDQPGSVIAELDLKKLEKVRASGQTRNYQDAQRLDQKSISLEL
jgi:predicted amidohydrolase